MLFAITGLLGCPVKTENGHAGTVKDFLFDDRNWRIRWMVVDTGTWLPGRKILIHPSAIEPLVIEQLWSGGLGHLGRADTLVVSVALSHQEIETSPSASEDQPVTQQMEDHLYDYYGWDPFWGATSFGTNAISSPILAPPLAVDAREHGAIAVETHPGDGDSHLRSASSVTGYHVEATDGEIGHVDNFLIDETGWSIHHLVIATRNWWPGKHVQLAPYAVDAIDWRHKHIALNVTRDQVKSSPEWDGIPPRPPINSTSAHWIGIMASNGETAFAGGDDIVAVSTSQAGHSRRPAIAVTIHLVSFFRLRLAGAHVHSGCFPKVQVARVLPYPAQASVNTR